MKIALACDHGGLNLKKAVIAYLEKKGHEYVDFGTNTTDSCDYPDFAVQAAEAVANGECERGIVVCSSGIGVSIVANKVPGIRCAHCHDVYCAKYTRYHNDANMIAFGEKVVGVGMMEEIVEAFLTCEYEGGERHDRRIAKIAEIEKKYLKKVEVVSRRTQYTNVDGLKTCIKVKEIYDSGYQGKGFIEKVKAELGLNKTMAFDCLSISRFLDKNGQSTLYTKFDKKKNDYTFTQILRLFNILKNEDDVRDICKKEIVNPLMKVKEIEEKAWEYYCGDVQ